MKRCADCKFATPINRDQSNQHNIPRRDYIACDARPFVLLHKFDACAKFLPRGK